MITYSTADVGTLAFSSAPAIAIAPRSLAEKSFSEPINLPMGVRAPATITDVVINTSSAGADDRYDRSRSAVFFLRLPWPHDDRSRRRPSGTVYLAGDGGRSCRYRGGRPG